jgi:hypothetical protein
MAGRMDVGWECGALVFYSCTRCASNEDEGSLDAAFAWVLKWALVYMSALDNDGDLHGRYVFA